MAAVVDVTDASFEQEVLRSHLPVVVDFWAPWCGPCRVIAPIMKDMAAQYGDRMRFVKLNIDDNPDTGNLYHVLSIPTLILFAGGQPQQTVVGARSKSHFEQAWAPWLEAAA